MTDRALSRAHLEAPDRINGRLNRLPVDAVRILDNGRDTDTLEVFCVYCGELHYHGGCGAPGRGDGPRVAHCTYALVGLEYVLREVGTKEGRSHINRRTANRRWIDETAERMPRRRSPIGPAQRTRILRRDEYRCRRCGAGPRDERLVIDHIMPVARGGTSEDGNLQTLCEPCNQGKADSLPDPHDYEGLR